MALLSPGDKFIDQATFLQYFPLDGLLAKRLFVVFDTKKTGYIDLEEFQNGLALCLHGTHEEKCKMIFDMCNLDGSDGVSPDELYSVLVSCVSASHKIQNIYYGSKNSIDSLDLVDSQKQVRYVVEQAFKMHDNDRTGKLSSENFYLWLKENPLLVDSIFSHESFKHLSRVSPTGSFSKKSVNRHLHSQRWMDSKSQRQESRDLDTDAAAVSTSNDSLFLLKWNRIGSPANSNTCWPQYRDRHAVCCHQGLFYLIGGRNGGVSYSDFWKWDPNTREWEILQNDLPLLQGHTAVVIQNSLVVFGGQFSMDPHCCLCMYNFDTAEWIVNKQLQLTSTLQMWQRPTNRSFHVAVIHQSDMCMYVHGGCIELKGITNEVWKFFPEIMVWQQVKDESGTAPSLCHHSAVIHREAIWIHGGTAPSGISSATWRLPFETMQWEHISTSCPGPALYSHTANKVKACMVVIGGKTKATWNDRVWLLHFDTHIWSTVDNTGSSPPFPFMDHSVTTLTGNATSFLFPVAQDRSTANKRQRQGTLSLQSSTADCKSDKSMLSLNDCDVELLDMASVALPGSVSGDDMFDGLKPVKTQTAQSLGSQEAAMEHAIPSDPRMGTLLGSHTGMYLFGGKTSHYGDSFGPLSIWHVSLQRF
ncbi:uncharacterized protein LOC134196267 isoform X2 [Corticium candelabrum]|nr:uncharacterized protein LOC134196267 isoform X2 [Corticium candelabrum]